MIGAPFDSWIGGTGATDNRTGSVVMIEVMRVLRMLGLKMDRTVGIGLWSGEEQGLFESSRAYVKENFGDPMTMQLKPAHAKFSDYFNHDNGTGKVRGVYLQGNDTMRPVFEAWLAPFRDLGVSTVDSQHRRHRPPVIRRGGVARFPVHADQVEYGRLTHHSNMDVYDHAAPADLMQAAAVISSVVYHAANRAEMLPCKELPPPVKLKN
jgi:Zn-dependent M28 family amino/carboxypeptidase